VLVLFFFLQLAGYDVYDFPAFIEPAIFANRVGRYQLVAMAARNKPDFMQGQMASPSSFLRARRMRPWNTHLPGNITHPPVFYKFLLSYPPQVRNRIIKLLWIRPTLGNKIFYKKRDFCGRFDF
jgi:hypothetical protein